MKTKMIRNKKIRLCICIGILTLVMLEGCSFKKDLKTHSDIASDDSKGGKDYKYFKDIRWINRNGVYSLSISPKSFIRWSINEDDLKDSWQELKNEFSEDRLWPDLSNEEVFYDQYRCHFKKAKVKRRWNIEPETEFINFLCN